MRMHQLIKLLNVFGILQCLNLLSPGIIKIRKITFPSHTTGSQREHEHEDRQATTVQDCDQRNPCSLPLPQIAVEIESQEKGSVNILHSSTLGDALPSRGYSEEDEALLPRAWGRSNEKGEELKMLTIRIKGTASISHSLLFRHWISSKMSARAFF